MFDYAKFYREQIEWANRQLDWYNKDLVTINKLLKRSRREDRDLVAYVCSKGQLTDLDRKIFVDKKYVGTETKRLLKMRREITAGEINTGMKSHVTKRNLPS